MAGTKVSSSHSERQWRLFEYWFAFTVNVVENNVRITLGSFGLDPLYVANEGLFVSVVEANIANEFLHRMQ